jgi:hypothetical protein
MAIYNTNSDSANTAVRAFLTKVGEEYLGRRFNTGSGKGKQDWENIKDKFNDSCAYCGSNNSRLTMEHLIPFNRTNCGLHHPGNLVPSCTNCNRRKVKNGEQETWTEHLESKAKDLKDFGIKKTKIEEHISDENYPKLDDREINALKAISNSLYESIKNQVNQQLLLYKEIDRTLVKK